MAGVKFTNFASTTIATAVIAPGDLSFSVAAASGNLFPTIVPGEWFYIVLVDVLSAPTKREVVKVTARSADVMTIVRAQEGTTAQSWIAGNFCACRATNQGLIDLITTTASAVYGSLSSTLVSFLQSGTGAVSRTVQSKNQEIISVFDFMTVAQIADIQSGALTLDVTVPFQAAITAAAGKGLFVNDGKYKITAALNILNKIRIFGNRRQVTVFLGTQNQNGFVFGDGTAPTRTLVAGSSIENIGINILPGVAAFASGAAIYRNYVFSVDIIGCDFYGLDAAVNKLWNGIVDVSVLNSYALFCTFQYLKNNCINSSGSAAKLTSDCFYQYCLYNNITGDAHLIGVFCAGLTSDNWAGFACDAYGIHILSSAGANGQNFFINEPDIQCDGAGGGIYVEQGNGVQINGGWIGGGTGVNPKLVWFGVNSNTCFWNNPNGYGGQTLIDGPVCNVTGGMLTGDNANSTIGIAVSATGVKTNIGGGIRIRQFTTNGIKFTGSPSQCLVDGVAFNNIGVLEITGHSFAASLLPPIIRGVTSDASYTLTAASNLDTRFGREIVQVTGATGIDTINAKSPADRQIIQAGAGGITINNGANIVMKGGANLAIPAFKIIEFVTDGSGAWFESTRNF